MKMHILKGSKQEIADNLARIHGEVREAIVFEEETTPAALQVAQAATDDIGDVFVEMRPFMVDVQDVDDSREAIYSRLEAE